MTGSQRAARLLLAMVLVGASLGAHAERDDDPADERAPRAARPASPSEQIRDACDAEAVSVRLRDAADRDDDRGPAPSSAGQRERDAVEAAGRLGDGVAREKGEGAQTLSWKRKGSKRDCRSKLRRLRRRYSGRVTFEPTTQERVAEISRRQDALIPTAMRKDAANEENGTLFDGGGFWSRLFGAGTPAASAALTPTAPIAPPSFRTAPETYSRPTLSQYRGPLTRSVPALAPAPAPRTWYQSVGDTYDQGVAYVSEKVNAAGEWASGIGRSVKNNFFSGVEMVQGYGYSLIRYGRHYNWGTKPLVEGLSRIAAYMRGSGGAQTDMMIGDISSAQGGKLGGHASHRYGKDVDIGFYVTDMAGNPVETRNFVKFYSDGKGGAVGNYNGQRVRFDAKRNWHLVEAIMARNDPGFQPEFIFIDTPLEAAVLAQAGNSPHRARAAQVMRYWKAHDNHLHLRVQ